MFSYVAGRLSVVDSSFILEPQEFRVHNVFLLWSG
jgi:hypothetical protein